MFETALKACIPIIGVHTDDLVNAVDVLAHYNPKSALIPVMKGKATLVYDSRNYWTDDVSVVNSMFYADLLAKGSSLIVLNPDRDNSLIFDAGTLPTPIHMLRDLLAETMSAGMLPNALHILRGLSLKSADQVSRITVSRDGFYSAAGLRKTRTQLHGTSQGLVEIDTDYDFYQAPEKLEVWLGLNKDYFLDSNVVQLRPRGVMLDGPPGVGKTMAAKYIAHTLGVPLFRMDIATALDKYIGVSEKHVQRMLDTVEREAPCVMLIDEIEKIFSAGDDGTGTVTRIMSQLLWWLAEHKSRVLTVMTTNAMEKIPAELHRDGRVDMTMRILKLSMNEAMAFMKVALASILNKKPTTKQVESCVIALKLAGKDDFSHIEVRTLVYDTVKHNKWIF